MRNRMLTSSRGLSGFETIETSELVVPSSLDIRGCGGRDLGRWHTYLPHCVSSSSSNTFRCCLVLASCYPDHRRNPLHSQNSVHRATMSCKSMELQLSCEAQSDLRSGLSVRRPPLRWGSTRGSSALPMPLAREERCGASDQCGRRSRSETQPTTKEAILSMERPIQRRPTRISQASGHWVTVVALRVEI